MVFNGAAAAEQVTLTANGNHLTFFRNPGNITMDTHGVENVDFNALGGADQVTVNDLTGTDLTSVDVDLANTLGGTTGDGQADRVIVNGTNGNDTINVAGDASGVSVSGLSARVAVQHQEPADELDVNGLAGNDSISATGLAAQAIGAGKRPNGDRALLSGGDDGPPQAHAAEEMALLDLEANRAGRAIGEPGADAIAVNRTLAGGPPAEVAQRAVLRGRMAGGLCLLIGSGRRFSVGSSGPRVPRDRGLDARPRRRVADTAGARTPRIPRGRRDRRRDSLRVLERRSPHARRRDRPRHRLARASGTAPRARRG